MIGIYDSGLGGLSVLLAVRERLPRHDLCYLADSAYCPYGPRSVAEVRDRALACAVWLLEQGARIIVVACNTASSAALELLRSELPVPVVGMEPGVKPAIQATRTGSVGVLATGGTLTSTRYTLLVQRFAANVNVQAIPCPKLVEQVEAGDLDSVQTRALVAHYLAPLQARNVDTIVLGCTHFHFLAPVIARIAGPDVTIIDTAPAVARQVVRVASSTELIAGTGMQNIATTGNPSPVSRSIAQMLGTEYYVNQAAC